MNDTLARFRAYMECQFHNPPFHHSVTTPFVTISRQAGAGGLTVARELADRLRGRDHHTECEGAWTIFDRNLVEEVLHDHHLSEKLSQSMSEDALSEVEEIVANFFGQEPSKWSLTKKTSETILRLAQSGHVILIGRGANIVTRRLEGGLHVRLVGSLKKRIEHLREYFGFSAVEASDFIEKEDSGRRRYVRKYFGADIDDPLLYDMVLNTDELGYEKASALIAHAVSRSFGAVESLVAAH